MHRLFVGIDPPEAVKDQLLDLMDGVAGARWQDEEQLHLTLRFVGEVDRHRADDVAAALEGLSHPRFELALSGVGAFDRRGVAHALWAGVTPPEPVRALHHKVEQAVVRAGLDPEHRAYHPHITIARLGRGMVLAMPKLLAFISVIGTAAMLWVGGHILLVGTHDLGWHTLYDAVHHLEEAAHDAAGALGGLVGWLVNTFASAIVGLVVGAVVVLVVTLIAKARNKPEAATAH